MKKSFPFLVMVVLLCTGCQPPEKTARDSIAAFNGYLTAAVQKHDAECKADALNKLPVCSLIVRAVRAQNASATALETYCQLSPGQGKDPAGPCTPVKSAQEGLRSAISNMNQLVSEIKGAAQ